MVLEIPAWGHDGVLRPIEKLAVHEQGLRHKAVSVFVTSGDRVLLQQRALAKYHTPGLWANTCCTHPFWGETDAACAKRRLIDELNLDINDLNHVGEIEYRADVGGGLIEHEVVQVFHAALSAPVAITPNPDEVATAEWVEIPKIFQRIAVDHDAYTPWFRIYMRDHFGMIFSDFISD